MRPRILIVCSLMLLAPVLDAAVLSVRARLAGDGSFQLAGVLPKNSAEQFELTFWTSIKDSKQVGDYEAYLQAYPKGRFAGLARARIEQLKSAAPQGQAPPQGPGVPRHEPRPPESDSKPAETRATARAPAKARQEPAAPAAAAGNEKAAGPTGPLAAVKDCSACPLMVALSPGSFTMGSNNGEPSVRPAHRVSIRNPYALGKFEVTVEQWDACVDGGACPSVPSVADATDNSPMRDVSWDEAQLYLTWLGSVSGRTYRLPTEAEWEYAARGGTSTPYWWGEQMKGGNASCQGCGQPWNADSPPPVGSFVANPFGFFDMNGSVWEWVSDCWHSSYKGAPADGSAWATPTCPTRVVRGGSWKEDGSYMLSTTRFKYDAGVRQPQNGFRVARDLK